MDRHLFMKDLDSQVSLRRQIMVFKLVSIRGTVSRDFNYSLQKVSESISHVRLM
jgi:hypothetical protein